MMILDQRPLKSTRASAESGHIVPVEPVSGTEAQKIRYESNKIFNSLMTGSEYVMELFSENDNPQVIRIGFKAYLRSIWALVWTAIVYPTKTSEIDLLTGQVVRHF